MPCSVAPPFLQNCEGFKRVRYPAADVRSRVRVRALWVLLCLAIVSPSGKRLPATTQATNPNVIIHDQGAKKKGCC